MISIKEIRQKYPTYNDLSDKELADALYNKHYSDMPQNEFYKKIGLPSEEMQAFIKTDEGIIKPFLRGTVKGAGQTLGDIIASTVNYPIEKLESYTGKQYPHVPHPNLINQEPVSTAESIGQNIGEFGSAFAIPGGVSLRVAKALRAAPGLIRGFGSAGAGALEGYLGHEDNRQLGGVLGGVLGGTATAIPALLKAAKNYSSEGIAKDVINRFKNLKKEYNVKYDTLLSNASEELPIKKFKPVAIDKELLKKAGKTKKDLHAIDKFNQNPTLENAHWAKSELGKIENASRAEGGNLNIDVSKSVNKATENLKKQIQENLKKIKNKNYAEEYENLSKSFKNEVVPYMESKTIYNLTKKENPLHPRYALKGFLREENTLSALGKHHPELRQREIIHNLLQNKLLMALLGSGLAGGAGAYIGKRF